MAAAPLGKFHNSCPRCWFLIGRKDPNNYSSLIFITSHLSYQNNHQTSKLLQNLKSIVSSKASTRKQPTIMTPYLLLLLTAILSAASSGLFFTIAAGNDLEDQIQQLNDLSDRRPIIRLNPDKFRRFVGSQSVPRNYSFIVMMTALSPQRGCHICRQAHEEFVVTATSYKNSQHYHSKRLYFGVVDYDEGQDIFNSLSINSAPCFLYFNEKGNFKTPDELNIQRLGFGADVISRWIAEKTGMVIKITRPPNMSVPIILFVFGLTLCAIIYMSRNSLGVIFNRNVWAITSVAIVLLMTSGQMWNHIRGAPLMQRGRNQNNYIHTSSSGQFVIETYLVLMINAGIAIGIVLMTDALRSGDKSEGKRKRLLARVGLFMTIFFFSLLLSIFRQKSYGYPYRLLFWNNHTLITPFKII